MGVKYVTFYGSEKEIQRVKWLLPTYSDNRTLEDTELQEGIFVWKQSRQDMSARMLALIHVCSLLMPNLLFEITNKHGKRFTGLSAQEYGNFSSHFSLGDIVEEVFIHRKAVHLMIDYKRHIALAVKEMEDGFAEYEGLQMALLGVHWALSDLSHPEGLSAIRDDLRMNERSKVGPQFQRWQKSFVYRCCIEYLEVTESHIVEKG
jgi:hypothetical protein